MRLTVGPYRPKRVSKRTFYAIQEYLKNVPKAPVEQLQKEAAEYEKMILARRAAEKADENPKND